MKNNWRWMALAGIALVSSSSFAQSTNETSAALEYKKVNSSLQTGDIEGAKKALLKAKEYIDLAAVNEKTKDSPKTLYYKGQIYSSFMVVGMAAMDTTFIKAGGDDAIDVSIAAFKRGYEISDKFDRDIEDAINEKKAMIGGFTDALFKNKNYAEVVELYDLQVSLSSAINIVDTASMFNSGISAENAGMWDKASESYKKLSEMGYHVPDIYKMAANALIQAKKTEEATAFLAKAIEKTPNDKTLYYVIGTFYMEMGENDKATENLVKATELDPKYYEAQYQLGAHYLTLASDMRKKASMMDLKQQKQADALLKESMSYYNKAVGPLEIYISAYPNEAAVLTSLFQIYNALDNPVKAAEYKKRVDELK